MAEIKSTLDIIMEKTKNLTMTEEEKKFFQKAEMEGKVKGLVQKFLDGFLSLEGLKREIESLGKGKQAIALNALTRECLARMDPEIDSRPILEILQSVAGVDPAPFRELQTKYRICLEEHKQEREKVLLKRLKGRGISGSAVLPNLNADEEWLGVLTETKRAFRDEVARVTK